MGDISLLLQKNRSIKHLNLIGNKIATPENLRDLLLGMVNNTSVIDLQYHIESYTISDGTNS